MNDVFCVLGFTDDKYTFLANEGSWRFTKYLAAYVVTDML